MASMLEGEGAERRGKSRKLVNNFRTIVRVDSTTRLADRTPCLCLSIVRSSPSPEFGVVTQP